MKRNGFVLAETLVVIIFVLIIFTLIYNSAVPLLARYDEISLYDDLDTTYDVYQYRRLVEASDNALGVVSNHYKKVSCADFSSETNRCNSLDEYLNVTDKDTLLYINTDYLNEVANDENIREEIRDYLNYEKIDPDKCIMLMDHDGHISYMDFTEYSITYNNLDLHGVTKPENRTYYYIGTETFTLINPTRRGYDFIGWTGSNGDTPELNVTIPQGSKGNRIYNANWEIKKYEITYDLDHGYEGNECASEGGTCTFSGTQNIYYGTKHLYNAKKTDDSVECSNDVFGDPTPGLNKKCYLGTNPVTYTVETPTFTLKKPTRPHYNFKSWNGKITTEEPSNEASETITISYDSVGNREYKAEWEPVKYNITCDYNCINGNSKTGQYTIESDSITLSKPTRSGYIFAGWTSSDLPFRTMNATIPSGSTGDKKFTAVWLSTKTLDTVKVYNSYFSDTVIAVRNGNYIFAYANSSNSNICYYLVVWNSSLAVNGQINHDMQIGADYIVNTSAFNGPATGYFADLNYSNRSHSFNKSVPLTGTNHVPISNTDTLYIGVMDCAYTVLNAGSPYHIASKVIYYSNATGASMSSTRCESGSVIPNSCHVHYEFNNAEIIGMAPQVSVNGYTFLGWSTSYDGSEIIQSYYAGDEDIKLWALWSRTSANVNS